MKKIYSVLLLGMLVCSVAVARDLTIKSSWTDEMDTTIYTIVETQDYQRYDGKDVVVPKSVFGLSRQAIADRRDKYQAQADEMSALLVEIDKG